MPDPGSWLLFPTKRDVSSAFPLLPGRDWTAAPGVLDRYGAWPRLESGGEGCRMEDGRAETVSADIMGGAPCDGVRDRIRDVRYWLWVGLLREGLPAPFCVPLRVPLPSWCWNSTCGVGEPPVESPSSAGGLEVWAELTADPRRDSRGEADVLASTHSSSSSLSSWSSSPRLNWTLELPPEDRSLLTAGLDAERLRLVDDLFLFPTSTWERLRFRMVCEGFFLRLVDDGSRVSFSSEVARRWWCEARAAPAPCSGEREPCLRFSFVVDAAAWCLRRPLEDGTRACRRPPVPPTMCFWLFDR